MSFLTNYFTLNFITATTIFVLGITGVALNRKNIISIIIAVELMLLGASFNFLIISAFLDDIRGQIFSLLILTVAAAESAIGLGILVVFYQNHQTISISAEKNFIFNLFQ